jgi:hypothetical protein
VVALAGCGAFVAGWVFLSRHVQTEEMTSTTAAAEFASAKARFAGQEPFIEFRGLQTPIVRRTPSAPRQTLLRVRGLSYDPQDEELQRVDLPAWTLALITAGGRLRVMSLGMFNDERDDITLEDLERHGPGLIIDAQGAVGPAAAGAALFGLNLKESRLLVWAE